MAKKKNVIIWCFHDPWGLTVINRLKKTNYNIYHSNFLDEKSLGYILRYNQEDLVREFTKEKQKYKKSIERKYKKFFNEYKNAYLSRNSYPKISLQKLRKVYLSQASFIERFLLNFKTNALLMNTELSIGVDFLFYRICKVLNIKTILLYSHTFFQNYLINTTSLEDFGRFKKSIKIHNTKKIKSNLPDEIIRYKMQRYIKPISMQFSLAVLMPKFNLAFRRSTIKEFFSDLIVLKKKLSLYKFLKKRKSLKFISDNLPINYVFFPLQEQPEASSISYGQFLDQAKICEIISKSLPKDFKLIIKDHQTQECTKHRDHHFYKRIKLLKNVVETNVNDNTEKLIKHAKILVTITGTAGFEALKHNVPCIIFGDSWFKNFKSVYKWNKGTSIMKILNTPVYRKNLIKDLKVFTKKLNRGYPFKINTIWDPKNNVTNNPDKLSSETASTIKKMLNKIL